MKSYYYSLVLSIFMPIGLWGQSYIKHTESDRVKAIRENIQVLSNGKGDFWTEVGVKKGCEYVEEAIFLDRGDHITFLMQDQTVPFEGSFYSESEEIMNIQPKQKGDKFRFKSTYTIKEAGDYFWRFTALDKKDYLVTPELLLILAKKDWAKYRDAQEFGEQLEFLLAISETLFIPIQGDFIDKDIKGSRYETSYLFQGKEGTMEITPKGYVYRCNLYEGEKQALAAQARDQAAKQVKRALGTNCLRGGTETTKAPYSLLKEYYELHYEACSLEDVEVNLYHYKRREDYFVQLEIVHKK